jgi:hypothetical protein
MHWGVKNKTTAPADADDDPKKNATLRAAKAKNEQIRSIACLSLFHIFIASFPLPLLLKNLLQKRCPFSIHYNCHGALVDV